MDTLPFPLPRRGVATAVELKIDIESTTAKLRRRGGFRPKLETVHHLHDIDAWRAALAMVQHYGPHALQRALAQIDHLRKAGDVIGATTWALIADAVVELTRGRRNDEPLN